MFVFVEIKIFKIKKTVQNRLKNSLIFFFSASWAKMIYFVKALKRVE